MTPKNKFVIASTLLLCTLVFAAAPVETKRDTDARAAKTISKIEFNRDIRPLLSENCYFCHGPDKNKRKADLRLDTKEGLYSKVEDRSVIVPGKPNDSEFFRRLITEEADDRMPQAKSNKKLSPQQIELFKRWIEEGAQWEDHWAFLPTSKPASPEVENANIVRTPVDRFVLAKLKESNLAPSPEADKITLIRRIYFDLIGLPPTPEQVDAFVNDKDPKAYEKVVDQLLASPQYGERMAIYWLDIVRYADSIGYHSDNARDVSPYRDWVIKAFNDNMHFDQFTIEQLAGDLLPNPTISQKVGSAYNRLNMTTEEGGAQPKEYTAKYAADRVRNISTAWMGLTMGCAECHDHKFDPTSTKDFYSMAAFFADIKEAAVGRREAGMSVPNMEQLPKLEKIEKEIADAKEKLAKSSPEVTKAQEQWESSFFTSKKIEWHALVPESAKSTDSDSTLKIEKDGIITVSGSAQADEKYIVTVKTKLKGITAVRLDALQEPKLTSKGPGRSENGNFVLSRFKIEQLSDATTQPANIALQNASADHEQPEKNPATTNPYKAYAAAQAIDPRNEDPKMGWAIGDKFGQSHFAIFETADDLGTSEEITLRFTLDFGYGEGHSFARFQISACTDERPIRAMGIKAPPHDVVAILKIERDKRTKEQTEKLGAFFRSVTPLLENTRKELAASEKSKAELLKNVPRTLISISDKPRDVRILPRGNWMDDTGEIVQPAVPHFLRQINTKDRATRMDLAKWLVSRDNPLTARVFVNRLWKMYFGIGLSKTVDDLGAQGEWPTHPELLEWLSTEFMDSRWDIKHMVRQIVLSSTYRQTSKTNADVRERDPFNRLLTHQSRNRLDAEIVRDNALAISGLLVIKIGGESVKPYQPDGYWDYLNFPKRKWEKDKGDAIYRRGLYTFWQRTFLHPSLLAFDAPSREECIADRPKSNTPLQALVLLNDPTYVEAARVFAQQIVSKGGDTTDAKITYAYRRALGRTPDAQETKLLTDLFDKHQKQYKADEDAAKKIIATGDAPVPKEIDVVELASWTSVSRTILNLHETITRE